MYFFPFVKKYYKSNLEKEVILKRIKDRSFSPDWNLTKNKIDNHFVMEGKFFSDSFIIVHGKYALSYGRTSLLPILKGVVKRDQSQSITTINVVIRPFVIGIIILSLFYFLILLGFFHYYFSKEAVNIQFCIISIIFIITTYSSLIIKFNKEVIVYNAFIESVISG